MMSRIHKFKQSNGNTFVMNFGDSKILTTEMIEQVYECKLICTDLLNNTKDNINVKQKKL